MGIKADIEAILFVCGDPVPVEDIARALNITELEASAAIEELRGDFDSAKRGILLRYINGKAQLCTNPACATAIDRLLQPEQKKSFSQSVLETLAIIAYKQPVTRAEIEAIRGVRCEYSVSQLLQAGMIEEVGRKDTVGRPVLFGTTEKFLQTMNIGSIADLPGCEAVAMLSNTGEGEADEID